MSQLLVQDFLKTHTLKELDELHGVQASFNKTGQFFSLNYDQLTTKDDDVLAQDCRGLILAAEDGRSFLDQAVKIDGKLNNKLSYHHLTIGKTRILCFGLRRFFNWGQGAAADIDFNDPALLIQEKKDGTLLQFYFCDLTNSWEIATRSVPQADLLMDNGIYTFGDLGRKALLETTAINFKNFTAQLKENITYCFELTSPLNQVVCRYPNNSLTLIAARNIQTLQELDIRKVESFGVPIVQHYPFQAIDKVIEWVQNRNPQEHEGIVFRDGKFNRVKLKSSQYVCFSKLRDSLGNSARNCLELILSGQEDDSIPYLPKEIADNLIKIKAGLQLAIQDHDLAYEAIYRECQIIKPNDKKTFAIALSGVAKLRNGKIWTAPLFARYDNKAISMHDFIMTNRKNGSWSSSFLDQLLEISKLHDLP